MGRSSGSLDIDYDGATDVRLSMRQAGQDLIPELGDSPSKDREVLLGLIHDARPTGRSRRSVCPTANEREVLAQNESRWLITAPDSHLVLTDRRGKAMAFTKPSETASMGQQVQDLSVERFVR